MRTWAGLTLLVFLSVALRAEEPALDLSPQNIQDTQQRLGEQVGRIGVNLEELLEEAQANLGVELQSFDTFRHTRERLADLSGRHVPSICSDLREPTIKAMSTAFRRQGELSGELDRLLLSVRRQLAPALSRRVLDSALKRQREALERTRELRTAYPDLEGLSAEALSEEQQRALNETADVQDQAATELIRAQTEIQRQGDSLSGGDLSARETLRRAQEDLQKDAAATKAAESAEDLRKNHTRQAEEKQEQLVKALKNADAALAPPVDPAARSSERLAALQEAVGQQTQALEETSRLEKGRSEDDLVRAARDQGEVSRRLQDLTSRQPDLKSVHAESEAAMHKLAEGEMEAARQAQEKTLKALQEALKEAASELIRAQNQEVHSQSVTSELDRLRALVRRQDELLARTRRVSVVRAHALSREQTDLMRETRALASDDSVTRTVKQPSFATLLESLRSLAEQAEAETVAGAEESEQRLKDARQINKSETTEESDPESFYGIREMLRQAEEQVQRSRAARADARKALQALRDATERLKGKLTPDERRGAGDAVAEAALRAAGAACQAACSEEQQVQAGRTQSGVLQAAALVRTEGLPTVAESLKNAGVSMEKATDELVNQRAAAAALRQQESLVSLEAASHRLAAELGQMDLATLLSLLRDETASLSETQARLSAETATDGASPEDLASRQEELRTQANRLRQMPGVPADAVKALGDVNARMRTATESFRQTRLADARAAQKGLNEALTVALESLREAAAAAQLGVPASPVAGIPQNEKPRRKNPGPAIEVASPPNEASGRSWDVALPPRERAEVNQALKEKMPARYRRQITLYYEHLSRIGLE